MALFDFAKGKGTELSLELVLAYLEAALRARGPFLLVGPDKRQLPGTIHSIHEDSKTFRLLVDEAWTAEKGDRVDFVFFQDGLRLGGTTWAYDARTGSVGLQLPETLELKERRRSPRARLNPKERGTLTGLQTLGEGVGINGLIENLSEGGVRVQVERAMAIATEKRLVPGTTLVPPGEPFQFIRLNQVPRCPATMELSGKAVYLSYAATGLVMGFGFDKLPAEVKGALKAFLGGRTTPIPDALPAKTRQRTTKEEVLDEAPQREARPAPPPAAEAPPPEEDPAQSAKVVDKRAALLRLKKLSRGMVVYGPAGFQNGVLRTFLTESGFGRVIVQEKMEALLECLRQPNLGALFIDWNGDTPEAIELMILLREAYDDLPPVVLAVRKVNEEFVLAARDAGASHLMVKPYACDEAFVAMLDGFFMHVGEG